MGTNHFTYRKKVIECKWVYKLKLKCNGTFDRYKAWLEAKGSQVVGIGYYDNFSPCAKFVIVCLFLSISSTKSWPIHRLDITNAFLHGPLYEDVYMFHPEG